jgi:RNA polymerase sigma factor (sigma-70 family)
MSRLTPEELEQHAASIRALAVRLVRDEQLAEDVTQETFVVALRQGVPLGAGVGPWLRGVGRNLARRVVRTESRRRVREEHAAAPAAVPAPDELAARTEARHLVVAELLRLEEPFRQTLLLRFFEGLAPAEIAAREGVPAATVRGRLKRGLDRLRARMDARHDGDRRAWLLPLAASLEGLPAPPLPSTPASAPSSAGNGVGGAAAASLTVGAVLMSWKIVTAASVVVLGGAAFLVLHGAGDATEPRPEDTAAASVPEVPEENVRRARVAPPPAAAPREDATEEPTTEAANAAVWVEGAVLGRGRHPAPGVEVALVTAWAPTATTVTDDDGRYRLPAAAVPDGVRPMAVVHARSEDGRAAVGDAWLQEKERVEVPPLVLVPAGAVEVRVESDGNPVEGALVVLHDHYRIAAVHTDAAGMCRVAGMPRKPVSVQAYHEELGRAHGEAAVDGEPAVLRLTRRDVDIVVQRTDGTAVAGADMEATFLVRGPQFVTHRLYDPPLAIEPTGDDGRTRALAVAADDDLTLTLQLPESQPGVRMNTPSGRAAPGATELRIELPALRTYRWRLVQGDAPPPAEGEMLTLLPFTNSGQDIPAETAVVKDAHLVIEDVGVASISCFARTDDGRIARLWARAARDEVRDLAFRVERHVEVRATRSDGSPAAGTWVVCKDQGNNSVQPPQQTGDDGVVRFERLHGGLVDVLVVRSEREAYDGLAVGTVDLDAGSASLSVVVPDVRDVTLRVTVNGEPRLPDSYRMLARGIAVVDEDPSAGLLHARVAPTAAGEPLQVRLLAAGCQPVDVAIEPGGPDVVDVALVASGGLAAHVVPPPDGRMRLQAERYDPEVKLWLPVRLGGDPSGDVPDADGRLHGDGLLPGRYRLRDGRTGRLSAEVDVRAGEVARLESLDLSRAGEVSGRVEVPEGVSVDLARVHVAGEGISETGVHPGTAPIPVRPDGTFRLAVPGDVPVTLRVSHALLRPAEDGGVVQVVEPRDDVVLRLERGPVVSMGFEQEIENAWSGTVHVQGFVGEPGANPDFLAECVSRSGRLSFGAPPDGTYTLWFDIPPYAPLVIRDVRIEGEDVDLGIRRCETGSSLRVKALVPDGAAAPRLSVWVRPTEPPLYSRGLNSNGETEVVLGGIGPGRHRVVAMPVMGARAGQQVQLEMDFDGEPGSVEEIELDAR